jgi:hypothetical protein
MVPKNLTMKTITFSIVLTLFISCGQQTNNSNSKDTDSLATAETLVQNPANQIPLLRDSVQEAPVQEYSEKTDNPLNDWYFSVKLYETSNTFHYLIKLQYEEIKGIDTLRLPNFGLIPQPVIQKGPGK